MINSQTIHGLLPKKRFFEEVLVDNLDTIDF
jgi:hypothetical protein